jgi:hypothetical protein
MLGARVAGVIPSEFGYKLRNKHVGVQSPDRECRVWARFVKDYSKPALIIGRAIGKEFSARSFA